jgi:hydrogenase large subunit
MGTISVTPLVITVDPVSRIEGHLKVEVTIEKVDGEQQVVDAKVSGTMFRGIEKVLENRSPLDAPDITQRICGVCPVSHALAASSTLEDAAKMVPPTNARLMRNLLLGANFLQSHVLHFYVLSALDYISGPDMPPWQPAWTSDKRVDSATTAQLVNNYVKALEIRRKCHEMGALFGGRLPHPPTFVPGGFTTTPRPDRISKFRAYLKEVTSFIEGPYQTDVRLVGSAYPDFFKIGGGYKNMIAFGVFDRDDAGSDKLFVRGKSVQGGAATPMDTAYISEKVMRSWYANSTGGLNPSEGDTVPVFPKTDAYSWLKAPRYGDLPCEAGPLARMWVSGRYTSGISVMDRHVARMEEALVVAHAMADWIEELDNNASAPVCYPYSVPASGTGVGLTEAPRGALGHWISIANGRSSRYQIITPTCWNASPRDERGQPGPMEMALIGTPILDINQPVEVNRVIHSFDPCLSCAVHVIRPNREPVVIKAGMPIGAAASC